MQKKNVVSQTDHLAAEDAVMQLREEVGRLIQHLDERDLRFIRAYILTDPNPPRGRNQEKESKREYEE